MRRSIGKSAFVAALVVGAFMVGRWHVERAGASVISSAPRRVLYYACPMHPQFKSEKPGTAPCCGMRYEPVYTEGASGEDRKRPEGAIQISAARQQLIGVEYAHAEMMPANQTLRAIGRVAFDQKQLVLVADVLEHEAPVMQVGQRARVTQPNLPDRSFWATVDYIYPRLDAVTRTLKVRLNGGETGLKLLPDTFVNVEFRITGPPVLAVPEQAVLDSGSRKRVFVDLGDGYLEPRQVETGRRLEDHIEILRGLMPGEPVVVSGNFLIDSETQLKALTKSGGQAHRDPVCGMQVDLLKATARSQHGGATYYFCAETCKRQFEGNPARYTTGKVPANKPAAGVPQVAQAAPGALGFSPYGAAASPQALDSGLASTLAQRGTTLHKDPVCGMEIEERNAVRRTVDYRGIKLYFCSEDCRRQFVSNPELYGQKIDVNRPGMPEFEVIQPPKEHNP